MKKLSTILLAVGLAVFLFVGSAMASPINASPINVRPDASLTNLGALQTFLNGEGQSISVYDDQSVAAFWQTSASEESQFTIMLEAAAWASSNKFGIYNFGDKNTLFEVFDGAAAVGYHASISFNAGDEVGKVVVNLIDDQGAWKSASTYYDVNSTGFGFYLDSTDAELTNTGIMYSYDGDNYYNGTEWSQYLAYAATGSSAGQWWICFEDQARWISADSDFTDFVIMAESINPVPEPATMLLLGFGLLGLGLARRKS